MIEKLNSLYTVELCVDISSVRKHDGSSENEQELMEAASTVSKRIQVIVVGESHATRPTAEQGRYCPY